MVPDYPRLHLQDIENPALAWADRGDDVFSFLCRNTQLGQLTANGKEDKHGSRHTISPLMQPILPLPSLRWACHASPIIA